MNTGDTTYNVNTQRFRIPICDKHINTEISNDYTLPDYLPEIRRILRVGVCVLPAAKYISGNSAEFNGMIDYDLVYVGADGAVYSAPLSAEYAFTAPLDISSDFDLNEGVISICNTSDESTTARVSAPRKLSIKCRLSAHIKAFGMMISEETLIGEVSPNSIERLLGECIADTSMTHTGDIIEASVEIPLPSESTRVANATANAIVTEAIARDGYIEYSGDILLKILACQDTAPESAEIIQKKIPFSDRIESEDISADNDARVCVYVSDINIDVEDSKIKCSVTLLSNAVTHSALVINYTGDLYSTEKHCNTSYKSYAIPTLLGTTSGNFSQSERIPLSETSIEHGTRLVDISCKPCVERAEKDKGKHIISGQCKYCMLLESNGEFSAYDITLPFKYESAGPEDTAPEYDTDIQVLSSVGRIDSGNLCIDTELAVNTMFIGAENIELVSSATFGEDIGRNNGDVIIYYPAPDDTVWSVAKKYSVPTEKISSMTNYILINM